MLGRWLPIGLVIAWAFFQWREVLDLVCDTGSRGARLAEGREPYSALQRPCCPIRAPLPRGIIRLEGGERMIQEGERLPDVAVMEMVDGKPSPVSLAELTKGKRAVLFAVPGAFTPTCHAKHLPGFVEQADAIRAKGVSDIFCLSVNDAFVMDAWGKAGAVGGKVRMLADGNGALTRALGLEMDASGFGMGQRSQRYAMIIRDGVVEALLREPGPGLSVSSAEAVLQKL